MMCRINNKGQSGYYLYQQIAIQQITKQKKSSEKNVSITHVYTVFNFATTSVPGLYANKCYSILFYISPVMLKGTTNPNTKSRII